nr:hypothetical protein 39 [bacterium]
MHSENVVTFQKVQGFRDLKRTVDNKQTQINLLREQLVAERESNLKSHSDQGGLTDIELEVLKRVAEYAMHTYELWLARRDIDGSMLCLGNEIASLKATNVGRKIYGKI